MQEGLLFQQSLPFCLLPIAGNRICVGDLIKSDPFGEILDNAGTAVIGNVSFDTLYLSAIDIDNQADVARRIAFTFIA